MRSYYNKIEGELTQTIGGNCPKSYCKTSSLNQTRAIQGLSARLQLGTLPVFDFLLQTSHRADAMVSVLVETARRLQEIRENDDDLYAAEDQDEAQVDEPEENFVLRLDPEREAVPVEQPAEAGVLPARRARRGGGVQQAPVAPVAPAPRRGRRRAREEDAPPPVRAAPARRQPPRRREGRGQQLQVPAVVLAPAPAPQPQVLVPQPQVPVPQPAPAAQPPVRTFQCPVCRGDDFPLTSGHAGSCGHTFCPGCAQRLNELVPRKCPMCRRPFPYPLVPLRFG